MPARHAIVTGRVQGVGFRYFVCELAGSMGIEGEVWNRLDGAVELFSCHADAAVLDEFLRELNRGPGRVDEVRIAEWQTAAKLGGFRIGPTRP